MKAIKYIFLSYFQQHFFGTLGIIAAFIMLITGSAYLINPQNPELKGMEIVFFAVIYLSLDLTGHLKRLIMSNAAALLPDYKRYQLITFGITLSFFIGVPLLLGAQRNMEILNWLTIFLFSSALIMWVILRFSDNLFSILILLWIIRLMYEILGLPIELRLFPVYSEYLIYISLGLIIVSLILFYLNIRHYFQLSVLDFENIDRDELDPWSKEYDKTTKIITKYFQKTLTKYTNLKTLGKSNINRLFRLTLFSPNQVAPVAALMIVTVLAFIYSVFFLLHPEVIYELEWMLPMLILIYHIAGIMLTTDFLQHRERLSLLWMYSNAQIRRNFIYTFSKSYIFIVLQNFLVISIVYFVIGLTFPVISLPDLLRLYLIGLFINLILIAISLIYFDAIRSPEAKGWTVPNMLLALILLPVYFKQIANLTPIVLLVLIIISILMIFLGIRKLYQSDLDFNSPAF